MKRKLIMLISILFCGSFSVVMGAENQFIVIKKTGGKHPYSYNAAGQVTAIDLDAREVNEASLTAEGKKIYDMLIDKYKHNKLTAADNNAINLMVLESQKRALLYNYNQRKYDDWRTTVGWDQAITAWILPFIGVGSAIASDYTGRALHGLLKGAANIDALSQQQATLQSVGDFVGAHKSIVPKTLLAGTVLLEMGLLSAPVVGPIHNKIVDTYNGLMFWWSYKKELALIDDVIKAIEAAR